jgi:hypothetical protein
VTTTNDQTADLLASVLLDPDLPPDLRARLSLVYEQQQSLTARLAAVTAALVAPGTRRTVGDPAYPSIAPCLEV